MDINTQCIHGKNERNDATGAVTFPIYQTATFAHPGMGHSTGYDYSRTQNPTRQQLEETVALLEKGVGAIACASGMAAITAVMELFSPGDHIVISDDLYGGTYRSFHKINEKNGISFTAVNTSNLSEVNRAMQENTRAVYIETPSNPMMQVTDLAGVAKIAKEHQALLIVDNTFLTPYFQRPIELGANIVVHSGTKYLCGHNDTLAGFIVVDNEVLNRKIREIYNTTGACLAPIDSWLLTRGIKTLGVRLERQQENALALARWLGQQSWVEKVYYIGLPEHPDYELSMRQSYGFGAMISFTTDTQERAIRILEHVEIIQFAESLGGVESLITYPMTQTHAAIPQEIREAKGINDRLLRLSAGIEGIEDLLEDLRQAAENRT
ncbi:MAG: PLP-dependent aspartate aminotransferase family protein [Lachnospiraceae bacterium]|nr:PLP-dependent aspartate aminotransferase family protein [Lachnospiraceae bacterium]